MLGLIELADWKGNQDNFPFACLRIAQGLERIGLERTTALLWHDLMDDECSKRKYSLSLVDHNVTSIKKYWCDDCVVVK